MSSSRALQKPLLNDEERVKSFFELLPEITFNDFLQSLHYSCRFNNTNREKLEAYLKYLGKSGVHFDNKSFDEAFSSFNNKYLRLNDFLERNFFEENGLLLLQPVLKVREPLLYAKQKARLKRLCKSTADEYIRAVSTFISIKPPKKPLASGLLYSKGTISYGGKPYRMNSRHQKMFSLLWKHRSRKLINAEGYPLEVLAEELGLAENREDVTKKMLDRLRRKIKDFDRYLRITKQFPIQIKVKAGYVYLMVK